MATGPSRTGARTAALACLALLVIGVVWIVTTYATQGDAPIPGIANANLAIGGIVIVLGLLAGLVAIVLWIVGAASRNGPPPTGH